MTKQTVQTILETMTPQQKAEMTITLNNFVIGENNEIYNYFLFNFANSKIVLATDAPGFLYLWNFFCIYRKADFEKIYTALTDVYNPLDNYNSTENRTLENTTAHTGTISDSGNATSNGTTSGENTATKAVTSFENNTFFDSDSNNATASTSADTSTTSENTKTFANTDTETVTESVTKSGNIGVTTSQQMLQAEIDLRIRNNIISLICDDFIKSYGY